MVMSGFGIKYFAGNRDLLIKITLVFAVKITVSLRGLRPGSFLKIIFPGRILLPFIPPVLSGGITDRHLLLFSRR